MKVNVDSVSPVSALSIADDQDKECSSKAAQNEQTATSCYTKIYREKKNGFFPEIKPHLYFKYMYSITLTVLCPVQGSLDTLIPAVGGSILSSQCTAGKVVATSVQVNIPVHKCLRHYCTSF